MVLKLFGWLVVWLSCTCSCHDIDYLIITVPVYSMYFIVLNCLCFLTTHVTVCVCQKATDLLT